MHSMKVLHRWPATFKSIDGWETMKHYMYLPQDKAQWVPLDHSNHVLLHVWNGKKMLLHKFVKADICSHSLTKDLTCSTHAMLKECPCLTLNPISYIGCQNLPKWVCNLLGVSFVFGDGAHSWSFEKPSLKHCANELAKKVCILLYWRLKIEGCSYIVATRHSWWHVAALCCVPSGLELPRLVALYGIVSSVYLYMGILKAESLEEHPTPSLVGL